MPSTFVHLYSLSPVNYCQWFLLCCAPYDSVAAKPHIGDHDDTATALITKVEKVNWTDVGVLYVEGKSQIEEVTEKLNTEETPFDGATVTMADVKRKKARRRRTGKNLKKPSNLGRQAERSISSKPSLKRKRDDTESFEEEVKRLAKQARNAGEKGSISEAEKRRFIRYLADLLPPFSWDSPWIPLSRT